MSAFFEVSFVVDPKRFGEVLALLDGKVYNVRHRLVRREMQQQESGEEAVTTTKTITNYDRAKQIVSEFKNEGMKEVKTKQVADAMGLDSSYVSQLMSRLEKEHHLKRVRLGMFEIVGAKS